MIYLIASLAVFFSVAASAQPVYMVDDQKACPELLRRFNIHPTQVATYPGDLEQCEAARKACYGIRDIIAKHCVEKMGNEYANELDYQKNMDTARIRATPVNQGGWGEGIQAVGDQLKSFCPGYLAKKADQVYFCKRADEMCDDGDWKLSTGHGIKCELFSIKQEDFMKFESGPMNLCKFARVVHGKMAAENESRIGECGQYGAVQGSSFGNGTPGANPVKETVAPSSEVPMETGEEGYAPYVPDDDLKYDLVPSPRQNSAFDGQANERMPEKGLVDQFFDLFR